MSELRRPDAPRQDDPYRPPESESAPAPRSKAELHMLVRAPALAMFLAALLSAGANVLGMVQAGDQIGQQRAVEEQRAADDRRAGRLRRPDPDAPGDTAAFLAVVLGIGVAAAVSVMLGAVWMWEFTHRNACITAAVLVMLPCIGTGCVIGLPVGIWALIVLCVPDVKTAFERNRPEGAET